MASIGAPRRVIEVVPVPEPNEAPVQEPAYTEPVPVEPDLVPA